MDNLPLQTPSSPVSHTYLDTHYPPPPTPTPNPNFDTLCHIVTPLAPPSRGPRGLIESLPARLQIQADMFEGILQK